MNKGCEDKSPPGSCPERGWAGKSLSYWRGEGGWAALKRALGTMSGFLLSARTIWVYQRSCADDAQIIPAAVDARCEEIGIERMAEIDAIMYHPTASLRRRFENGERCFVAVAGEMPASYAWVVPGKSRGAARIRPASLRDDQFYLYNVRTLRKMRGKALYAFLLTSICSLLAREGFREAVIRIDAANRASIAGVEKAGFVRAAALRRRRFFGFTREHSLPLEETNRLRTYPKNPNCRLPAGEATGFPLRLPSRFLRFFLAKRREGRRKSE